MSTSAADDDCQSALARLQDDTSSDTERIKALSSVYVSHKTKEGTGVKPSDADMKALIAANEFAERHPHIREAAYARVQMLIAPPTSGC